MPRPRKNFGEKKDPFEELDEDFKNSIQAMDEADIRRRISDVALADAALRIAKDDDMDLQKAKEVAKEAGAIYREGAKANKLKISFCKRVLEDRGKAT
jgi:DNA polymerase III delta prime subunit